MNPGGMGLGEFLGWELFRWLSVLLGYIPGAIGIFLRYIVLRWFLGGSNGFFRLLERVTIEYPRGLHIGRGSGLNLGCWLNARGGIHIGENVIMGPYCVVHSANHRMEQLDVPVQFQGHVDSPVVVEDNVWLGARVTVLPGVTIGKNAVIGAGSVVTKDIPANAVAAGNPAKVIRSRVAQEA